MLQSNLVFVSTAALILGAGVMVGRVTDRLAPPPPRQEHSRSWMDDQLKLTADQRKTMDAIWTDTRQQVEKAFEHRRDMDKQREQAILGLLSPDQKAAYDKINSDFRAQRDDLFKQRDALVQRANDMSRSLLDPDQQKEWDLLTKEMRERHGWPGGGPGRGPGPHMFGPGHDGPGRDGPADNQPTTVPTGSAVGAAYPHPNAPMGT
jgi:Spy/CpxP family protein refolding chaperone